MPARKALRLLHECRTDPHHAIKSSLAKLYPGSTAVVIGAGGLGHVAIQTLRAITSAAVVALDVDEKKLALASEVGAHQTIVSGPDAVGAISATTGGIGAATVFDFVGAQPALDIAREAGCLGTSSGGHDVGTRSHRAVRAQVTERCGVQDSVGSSSAVR